jgi:hypothetical protein
MFISLLGLIKLLCSVPNAVVSMKRPSKKFIGNEHLVLVKLTMTKTGKAEVCMYNTKTKSVVLASQAIKNIAARAADEIGDKSSPFWQNMNADLPDYNDAP